MKKVFAFMVLFSVCGFLAAQDGDGVDGWLWSKSTDAMTDQVSITFLKTTVDDDSPAIMLLFLPEEKRWVWGLLQHDKWTSSDTVKVAYRLGKDKAQTHRFIADGGRFYTNLEDVAGFVSSQTVAVQPDGSLVFKYDLSGLAKTIAMAGVKLK